MAPTLTILAPTHDRAEVLARVWPTWMAQQGLSEIVIVDDGSTQDYRNVFNEMRAACTERGINLKVIRSDARRGAPAAKNLGLEHCTSEELLTTDDDILLPADMVAQCRVDRPEQADPVIVGPRVIYLKDGESEKDALARADEDRTDYFNYRSLTLTPWVNTVTVRSFPFVTAVALWPASLFKRGLRYHEGYGGNGYREETDPQLTALAEYSASIFLVPRAVCFHLPPSLAYVKRGGQRRGNRLWFEFWVHYNNAKFLARHRETLRTLDSSLFESWISLFRDRLGARKIVKYLSGGQRGVK
ncbi:glycosyltransferase [Aquabacterium sp.]|uniref:glycosyltransferase family 2 protein n=1 Tax=Aquabacterium sp. TaxID=1872578 RepID=UPI003D026FE8